MVGHMVAARLLSAVSTCADRDAGCRDGDAGSSSECSSSSFGTSTDTSMSCTEGSA